MSEVSTPYAPLFVFILAAVTILPAVVPSAVTALASRRIFAKSGHHGALGLLVLIPMVGIVPRLRPGCVDWPVQRSLRHLVQRLREGESR